MDELQSVIEERLKILPQNVAAAINAVPWAQKIKEIGLKYGLDADTIDNLQVETAIVVFGMESPENYPESLSSNVGLDDETIESIVQDVDEAIIKPITNFVDNPPVEEGGLEENSIIVNPPTENVIHNDLPMVEEGEQVRDVPHDIKLDVMPARTPVQSGGPKPAPQTPPPAPIPVPTPTPTITQEPVVPPSTENKTRPHSDTPVEKSALQTPDYRYPGGADPYREPLQ